MLQMADGSLCGARHPAVLHDDEHAVVLPREVLVAQPTIADKATTTAGSIVVVGHPALSAAAATPAAATPAAAAQSTVVVSQNQGYRVIRVTRIIRGPDHSPTTVTADHHSLTAGSGHCPEVSRAGKGDMDFHRRIPNDSILGITKKLSPSRSEMEDASTYCRERSSGQNHGPASETADIRPPTYNHGRRPKGSGTGKRDTKFHRRIPNDSIQGKNKGPTPSRGEMKEASTCSRERSSETNHGPASETADHRPPTSDHGRHPRGSGMEKQDTEFHLTRPTGIVRGKNKGPPLSWYEMKKASFAEAPELPRLPRL